MADVVPIADGLTTNPQQSQDFDIDTVEREAQGTPPIPSVPPTPPTLASGSEGAIDPEISVHQRQAIDEATAAAEAHQAAPATTIAPEPLKPPSDALIQSSATLQVNPEVAAKVAEAGISPVVAQAIAAQYPSANIDPTKPEQVAPFALHAAVSAYQAVHGVPPAPEQAIKVATQGPAAVPHVAGVSNVPVPGSYRYSHLNNPGNIGFGAWAMAHGASTHDGWDTGHSIAGFPDLVTGYQAMAELARSKYHSGKTTLDELIAGPNGWTPNNHEAAANIARSMGISPNEDLRLDDPKRMAAFQRGLTLQETGSTAQYDAVSGNPELTRQGVTPATMVHQPAFTNADLAAQATERAANGYSMAGATYEYLKNDSLTANLFRDARDYSYQPDPTWHVSSDDVYKDERFKALPDPIQEQAPYLLDSVSKEDYESRLASLQSQADYERHMADSGASGTWGKLVGSLLDPTGWLVYSVPAAGSSAFVGKLAKVLWEGGSMAALGAGEEYYRERHESSVSPMALVYGAAGGAAFGLGMGGLRAALHPRLHDEADALRTVNEGVANGLEAKANGAAPKEVMNTSFAPQERTGAGAGVINGEAAGGAAEDVGLAVASIGPVYLDPDAFHAGLMSMARSLDEGGFAKADALEDEIMADRARLMNMATGPGESRILQAQLDELRSAQQTESIGRPFKLQEIGEQIAQIEGARARSTAAAQASHDEAVQIIKDRLAKNVEARASLSRQLDHSIRIAAERFNAKVRPANLMELSPKAQPSEAEKVMAPIINSTVGAAQFGGSVEPVRGDIGAASSAAFRQDFSRNKVVTKGYRPDTAGWLRSSKNAIFSAIGSMAAVDAVGNADHSVMPLDIATVTKRRLQQSMQARATSQFRAAYRQFAQEQGWNVMQRVRNYNTFTHAVADAIEATDRTGMNKHVVSAADNMRKLYGEWAEMARNPGMLDGTTMDPLNGAPDSDPTYYPRLWTDNKFSEAVYRFGDDQMRKLVKAAARSKLGPDVDPELIEKIGNALYKGLRNVQAGQNVHLSRMISGEDMDGLAGLLKQNGMAQEDVDNVLGQLSKPNPAKAGEGPIGRLKQRTPLDMLHTETLIDPRTGDAVPVALKDMTNRNALSAFNQYSSAMAGQVALARMRIPNPTFDPTLPEGETNQRWIVDGIRSQGERDKLIKQAMAHGDDLRANYPADAPTVEQDQKNAKVTNFLLDHLTGIMGEDDKGTLAAVARTLGNINFARLMGQVGFVHAAQVSQMLSQAGLKAAFAAMPTARAFVRDAVSGQLSERLAAHMEATFGFGTEHMRGWDNHAPMDEYGNYITNSPMKAAENLSQRTARMVAVSGGLSPVMEPIQRTAGRAALAAFALDATGAIELNMRRMAVFGIGEADRNLIAKEMNRLGLSKGSAVNADTLANFMDKLNDMNPKARYALVTGVQRWAEKMAQTNDPGMMIAVLGTRMGKLISQFRSYAIGSYANATLHSLHQRDAAAVAGFLTASAMGTMSYVAQTYIQSLGREDRDRFLSYRLSPANLAAAAIHRGGYASLLPQVFDTASYAAGGPTFFSHVRSTGQSSDLIGGIPVVGMVGNVLNATRGLSHPLLGEPYSRMDAQALVSTMPFGNTLPVLWAANQWMNGMPYRDPQDPMERH